MQRESMEIELRENVNQNLLLPKYLSKCFLVNPSPFVRYISYKKSIHIVAKKTYLNPFKTLLLDFLILIHQATF